MAKNPMELKWQEIPLGFVWHQPQSSLNNHTGSWRSERPIWDEQHCIRCGVCGLFCPEACIRTDERGYFHADLDYCKGCSICAHECWTGCIKMKPEEA
jgi:pyruvate ferredoxin oxidoreductase delta subunit